MYVQYRGAVCVFSSRDLSVCAVGRELCVFSRRELCMLCCMSKLFVCAVAESCVCAH